MSVSKISDDFDRLGGMTLRALPTALALAFASTFFLLLVSFSTSALPAFLWTDWISLAVPFLFLLLFAWLHGVFIAAVAWGRVHSNRPWIGAIVSPGFKSGALVVLPITAFALLEFFGSSYSCAEGRPYGQSFVPDLPWLWIGWLLCGLTALPARCIGLVIGEQPPLIPLARRALLILPLAPAVWFFGVPFQSWRADCSLPPLECCGLFEGGLFVIPLLGIFMFVACFTLAVWSAASVDQGER